MHENAVYSTPVEPRSHVGVYSPSPSKLQDDLLWRLRRSTRLPRPGRSEQNEQGNGRPSIHQSCLLLCLVPPKVLASGQRHLCFLWNEEGSLGTWNSLLAAKSQAIPSQSGRHLQLACWHRGCQDYIGHLPRLPLPPPPRVLLPPMKAYWIWRVKNIKSHVKIAYKMIEVFLGLEELTSILDGPIFDGSFKRSAVSRPWWGCEARLPPRSRALPKRFCMQPSRAPLLPASVSGDSGG